MRRSASSAVGALWPTKAALLIIVAGLCVVGRSARTWPIVTWPMYSTDVPAFPPPRVSAVELRVIKSSGDLRTVAPSDLFPFERSEIAKTIIEHVFGHSDPVMREADRAYLVKLIKHRLPDVDAKMIQGWKLHWEVDPMALPPLSRDDPAQRVLLDSFAVPFHPEAPAK